MSLWQLETMRSGDLNLIEFRDDADETINLVLGNIKNFSFQEKEGFLTIFCE